MFYIGASCLLMALGMFGGFYTGLRGYYVFGLLLTVVANLAAFYIGFAYLEHGLD